MTCEKSTFRNRNRAKAAARRVASSKGVVMREYHCPDCGRWHLSSSLDGPDLSRLRRGLPPIFGRAPRARTLEELEALAEVMRGPKAR